LAVPSLLAESAAAGTAIAKVATAAKGGGVALGTKLGGGAIVLVVAGASVFGAYQQTTRSVAPPASVLSHPVAPTVRAATLPAEPARLAAGSEEPTVTPPNDAPSPRATRALPATPKAEVGTELQLLQRARSLLRNDPSQALALTARHQREFPDSQFVQERQVIRIDALRALGRDDEAGKLGADFKQRFPDSAHGSRLDSESP
jgi:hypothetical protein